MKTLIAASALVLASFAASAQPAADDNTVTITGNQHSIALPESPRSMGVQEFSKFTGSYEMANGNSIALFSRAGIKYAALHGDVPHALVAKSSNTFVAKDGQLEVTLDRSDEGKVSGEVFMVVPVEKVAGGAAQQRVVNVAFH